MRRKIFPSLGPKKGSLYIHISPSNKIYVGITSRKPKSRGGKNGNGYKKNQPLFGNAIQKYGGDNFQHIVLGSNLYESLAKDLEIRCIKIQKRKNMSYNITNGGDGTSGCSIPIENRGKINKSRERSVCQFDKDYNLIQIYASIKQAEIITSISSTCIQSCCAGKVVSAGGFLGCYKENIDNIKDNKDKRSNRRKAVSKFDLFGNGIEDYDSLSIASEQNKIDISTIQSCCKNRCKSANGFQGSYVEDKEKIDSYVSNGKKISQYTKDGRFIKTFNTMAEAAKEVNINYSSLRNCCNPNYPQKSAGGFLGKIIE